MPAPPRLLARPRSLSALAALAGLASLVLALAGGAAGCEPQRPAASGPSAASSASAQALPSPAVTSGSPAEGKAPAAPLSAPPSASPPAPLPAARPTAEARARCEAIGKQRDDALSKARVQSEELRGEGVEKLPPSLGACFFSGQGAWALAVDEVAEASCRDGCARVSWRPTRVMPDGSTLAGPALVDVFPRRGLDIDQAVVFDWDGDGEAELFVHRSRVHLSCDAATGARDEEGAVYAVKGGRVEPLEQSSRPGGKGPFVPRSARDVDGDGRPDLGTIGPYRAVLEPACRGSAPDVSSAMALEGPLLFARALPDGSFSFDDPAARAENKKTCPGRPKPLVSPMTVEKLALDRTTKNLVCARLWGLSGAEVEKALDENRALVCRAQGPCPALEQLKRLARLAPPFQFLPALPPGRGGGKSLAMSQSQTPRRQNRLAREASAYLRQHAHNPVDWYPWGEEALAKARAEDKPILLSIGYSACHWCHVMERESFEDEATALLMNAQFVNIKVDREERPDLDQIYQTVVQLMGRSGGWPLTVFLTPDQKPFFGGTYFPPVPRHGMRSFQEILNAVREAYDAQREDVVLQADEITRAIGEATEARGQGSYRPGPDLLERAAGRLSRRFDDEHGGIGSKPKFPSTMLIDVLVRRAAEERDGQAEARARRALDAMRAGGIWDHLGSGFHRYSTDEKWLVPHFEKMLYDNALLCRLYADASRAFSSASYRQVARDIASYLMREMQSPEGAFYATQDADSEGEEGKFFVWKPSEIDALMPDPLSRDVAKLHYGITEHGNFEQTGATVLSEALSLDRIAIKLARAPSEIEAALERARRVMLEARERRPRPFRDEKMLACWNGLAIASLADLGALAGEASLVEAAKKAFAHLERALVKGGRVGRYVAVEGGREVVKAAGFLDDHANLCVAALELYEASGEPRYASVARAIGDEIIARFYDPEAGDFFFPPSDGEALVQRMKDPYDQATPSGAAMAATALMRLGSLFGEAYQKPAERYLEAMAAAAVENPFGLGQTVCALDRLVRGAVEVVIVGARGKADTEALRRAAFEAYLPNRSIVLVDPADPSSAAVAADLSSGKHPGPSGEARAYVCRGRSCSAPVAGAAELASLLSRGD